ncbi:MAG: transpeptidase family protein [Gemmatimonadetes bacterium]|nr:transpeptidase family protein [Gemmatimonadota bacterium]
MEAQRLRSARRQGWLYLILLAFGARLAWGLLDIQVLSHDAWLEAAQRQQKKRVVIAPQRGRIYDRNGVPLAVNREQYEIYLVPRHIVDVDRFVERLTAIVPYDEGELRGRIARGGWYVRLLRGVDRDTVKRLEKADIDGVGVETYQVRHYPHGDLARSLLGRVGPDNRGLEGLELQYDEGLRGTPGYAIHQRDALGREYPNFSYPVEPPVDGKDVWLTIDIGMQEIVEAALDDAMERTRAQSGSVVVVDPRTGEVVAMSSRPADASEGGPPLVNRAIVDPFEPGSTFKIVTLAGLYEERLAAPGDSIFCEEGRWNHDGRIMRDVHPYGWMTVEQVIEESSNICSAKLAARLGEDRLYEYARRFGFGLPTGLDFPGEPRGLLKRPDRWSALTPASMAMGYEVMVTAMQMAMAYAAIANGGELLRPYLVRKVASPTGAIEYEGEPQRIRRVMRTETARLITQALVRVVEVGTARSAQIDVLPVAGKTGTARKTGESGRYVQGRYTSSFVGFFPAVDARYAMFVRIDEPVGAFYGGTVAAPVFRQAMESSLVTGTVVGAPNLVERMRTPERVVWTVSDTLVDLPVIVDDTTAAALGEFAPDPGQSPLDAVVEPPLSLLGGPRASYVVDVGDRAGEVEGASVAFDPRTHVKVPDFEGVAIREAVVRAARLGLRLRFEGTGRIVAQHPEPGEVVPRGGYVRVKNP